jgi:hypothetical protein
MNDDFIYYINVPIGKCRYLWISSEYKKLLIDLKKKKNKKIGY